LIKKKNKHAAAIRAEGEQLFGAICNTTTNGANKKKKKHFQRANEKKGVRAVLG
jgi:hypothetical protein